jgi:spore coat protein CotF
MNQNTNQTMNMNQNQSQSQSQSQNKIANPSSGNLPKVKGPQLNDRDRINDVLNMEKYLSSNTSISAWEASHQQLHQDILTIFSETQQCHRQLFNLMFQKGWYKLEAADQNQLDQTYQQFSNYSSQFPYQTQLQ